MRAKNLHSDKILGGNAQTGAPRIKHCEVVTDYQKGPCQLGQQ